jgi:hypothetical protein
MEMEHAQMAQQASTIAVELKTRSSSMDQLFWKDLATKKRIFGEILDASQHWRLVFDL